VARDFYEVLGVPRDAGNDQIQQVYRKLARRFHPDVNSEPGAEERFKEVSEAYQVLSDPETRRRYDQFGPDFRQIPPGYAQGWPGGGTRVRYETGGDFGGFDFEDLFANLFAQAEQGRDVQVDLPLTPWEAALGATVPVVTPRGEAKVRVPPGTSSGRRLRLRGEGRPGGRGRRGDLYAVARIMVPRRLSRRERELFEQLAAESTFDPRK
jgi:curved DNA-binding protein